MCASNNEGFSRPRTRYLGYATCGSPRDNATYTKARYALQKLSDGATTAYHERPYAPLLRDDFGRVQTARETHLEQAEHLGPGESNIGMFMLKSEAMFGALIDLNRRYWSPEGQRYQRPAGELGFPNELINYFSSQETGVFACPIADTREEQGIKTLDDVARCERFISELAQEQS